MRWSIGLDAGQTREAVPVAMIKAAMNARITPVSWIALASALATCSAPASRHSGADSTLGEPPDVPPPAVSREIYIDSVRGGNPLVVMGRARTFENTVQARLRDARGVVIAQTFTTSVGEMGHHNPFTAQLWIVRDPGGRASVEAFEYSAKDGSVRSLTSLEVVIGAARMPVTVFFPLDDCHRVGAFTRSVPRTVAVARVMTEILVAGPDSAERAAGASMPFPAGSRVNSVLLRGDEITVDFNERLQNVGGSCAVQAIRLAVTRTLQELPAVRRVVITANGSRDLALQP